MSIAIDIDKVTKTYPLYHHISTGIKQLLLSPKTLIDFYQSKHYLAIENVSFSITAGESIGIIGKNGAGKSTLLSLIAGVLQPTIGTIKTTGRIATMLELGGGFHPDLSGRENIRLNAILMGLTRKEVNKKIDAIIEFSELNEFIDEPIRIYSSGMLAKLGFSVIVSIDPDILIIDEVLAVGDIRFQKKCTDVISQFRQRGVTIILVSHNMHDINLFCDKAIWVEDRRLKMIDDAAIVTTAYIQNS